MSGPVTTADCGDRAAPDEPERATFDRLPARAVEVGGIPVRRALPRRARRTIGAWCFVDHFGPVAGGPQMEIGPHPHIGLQTVTWLVEGEVLHRDSLGSEQLIRPGQLNLMTAGHGVAHSEETRPGSPPHQHGAQLWVAQPDATRDGAAAFEHHAELPRLEVPGGEVTVLVGEVAGQRSPARTDTPLVGAVLSARDEMVTTLPLDPQHEHGAVVLAGAITIGGERIEPGELVYLGTDRSELALAADAGSEVLLLGGAPFPADLVMWWNFVGRTRAEMAAARTAWEAGDDRFGPVETPLARIPAPPIA